MDRTRIGQITPHMAQKRADTKQVFLLSLLHYVVVYMRSCSCGLIVTQTGQVRGGGYEQLKQWFMTLSLCLYCPSFRIFRFSLSNFPKVRIGRSFTKLGRFLQVCSIFLLKVSSTRLIIHCKRGYVFRLKRAIIRRVTGILEGKLKQKYIKGGSNMTGTDLCVKKPHCAAAVRP